MFNKCYKLKEIKGINNFDISKVINKERMFEECFAFENNKELISKFNLENSQVLGNLNGDIIPRKNITVYFMSTDKHIDYSLSCYNNDNFSMIEEKLNLRYPELKHKNIYFLSNGNVVNKSLTLEQNNIKNESNIIIYESE